MPRTHTGVVLGNARFGAMVWGENNVLRITLGRADLWDHRGGLQWTENQAYSTIRDCLERNDKEAIDRLFAVGRDPGQPRNPSVLPIGRFELVFPESVCLDYAELDMRRAQLDVHVREGTIKRKLSLFLDVFNPLLVVELPVNLRNLVELRPVPAWSAVGDYLASVGFSPPEVFVDGELCLWRQQLPADSDVEVLCRRRQDALLMTACLGSKKQTARERADELLALVDAEGLENRRRLTREWWSDYWAQVPTLSLPSPNLQFLYEYGMYKFAGLTAPHGVPATLQGPWIEDYQMPPWSSDYHFNINVQMCYWPAYHGNCLEHLRPLFDLIHSWMPVLKRNAKVFINIDDGVMLPHAVDDRCTCMGGMWTGTIDHGCTAWVAQMMYRYYRYTKDLDFLREQAFPFMKGAMRVYEEMLERDQNGNLGLPVSVSPEYRGGAMNAWGRNASFQLACIHRLCEDLNDAAEALGTAANPEWERIQKEVPKACIVETGGGPQIALWEGTILEESHRHHSHLAGITPFDVFDSENPSFEVIVNSIKHWIKKGMGLWSGWCVPWASMIHSRLGNADAAELWLDIWQRLFTNEGHGTRHDVAFPGLSLTGMGALQKDDSAREKMQMDAAMSCVAAIQEMLLHVERGVTVLFKGAPKHWGAVGFEGITTEGGFRVSAERTHGVVSPVTVESPLGGTLRLANPWPSRSVRAVYPDGHSTELHGEILEVPTEEGEVVVLK
ncbi:MAG: glycosyl hydrolase family 95 catalytic domain-containing protein [Verrucomicrobiota bacterium]